ncbi:acyltransferase family protein [Streptomyces luteolifulvus]|jgi:fucose 4-O-acetylase-like acetyltransferase|uniref:Acyltransferase family protein n=1 Tax=Streptomyces luteolifulvus TaxID=2615112 RepID=A0A6H9UQC6_9ACTN|nr:acyltransferase family protein [Streptomyces luteolifulvus]KAB1140219.1 acyltransferase family protein [Streptomyces luteolifulvus]
MDKPLPRPAAAVCADRSRTAERDRNPWWDNARFLSATLIVVLHTCGSIMAREDALHSFHIASWAFRVPAFVMLAGVFSNAGPLGPRPLRTLLQSIVLPALAFSLLFSLESYWLGAEFTVHVVELPWTLWFLMSLFFWRLLLPLVVQLRHPLLVTTGVSLAVGYVDEFGMAFSASRTLVYLPLFYLGWRIGQGYLNTWFTSRWSLPVAVAGILASCVVGWLWHRDVKGNWLSMRHPYAVADPLSLEWAWLIRLLVLASAAALVLCLLRLMPRRRLPLITTLGAGGFTIYLLHPLVILPVREQGWISRVDTGVEIVGLVLCAILLTMVLGSPPVRRLVRPLTRPSAGWLLAPAATGPEQPTPVVAQGAAAPEPVRTP